MNHLYSKGIPLDTAAGRPMFLKARRGLETDISMTTNPCRISILACFVDFWTQLGSNLSTS